MTMRVQALGAHIWPLVPLLGLVAACSLLAFVNNVLEREVTLAMIYLILVISLYTFTGNSGVASFGHISFMAIGAYTAGLLTISPLMKLAVMSQLPDFIEHAHWGSAPAVIMGGVVAAVFATVVSIPLMRLSGLAASLATFAVLNIVFIVSDNWTQVTNGSAGIADIPTATTALGATAWALLVVCVAFAFQATRSGLRLSASREDDVAAQSIGIMIVHERRVSFVLSAFIGGIGGGVFAQFIGSFNAQSFYLSLTFLTFVMLVVGGTRSLAGAGSAACSSHSPPHCWFVSRAESRSASWISRTAWTREVALALIMLATLILRPTWNHRRTRDTALSSIPAGSFIDRFRAHRKLSQPTRDAEEQCNAS